MSEKELKMFDVDAQLDAAPRSVKLLRIELMLSLQVN